MQRPSHSLPWRSLAIALLLSTTLLGALVLVAPPAAAATILVRGHITANTVWTAPNTYEMTANVTVDPSVTLTIQPGVAVLGQTAVRLYVEGTLTADGTPSSRITFGANGTSPRWGGIQFNSTGGGSVTWSKFDSADVSVAAITSSPPVANNLIVKTGTAFRFTNSGAVSLVNNTVDKATALGIDLISSSGQVQANSINDTDVGISARASGALTLTSNTITNITGTPTAGGLSVGIYVTGVNSASIQFNTVRRARGMNGTTPGKSGARGTDGTLSAGIMVNGTGNATLFGNSVSDVAGGRGGDGAGNASGTAGNGGVGGGALGILVTQVPSALIQWNTITNVAGGAGGDGGSTTGLLGGNGGPGGPGGSAVGLEIYEVTAWAPITNNWVQTAAGGKGGDGGIPSGSSTVGAIYGNGGAGGDAYAVALARALSAQVSAGMVLNITGGAGGSSGASPASPNGANGGSGGQAVGIGVLAVDGPSTKATTLHGNTILGLAGGDGGLGHRSGGDGGNATGLFAFGDGTPFNTTLISGNSATFVAGGHGGNSTLAGGDGGGAAGLVASHVTPAWASNSATGVQGGTGGNAQVPNLPGLGGQALGLAFDRAPSGSSTRDQASFIASGAPGAGSPRTPSDGVGMYFLGTSTQRTVMSTINGTLSNIGTYALYVDNYSRATTVNTTFGGSPVQVQPAGNLTVRNFLAVQVRWPNNLTFVAGSTIKVQDNGATAWNITSASGRASWLLVTDRVYVGSSSPSVNTTRVTVTFPGYAFARDPRTVNMSASHTEYFVMVDQIAPTSWALPLPAYEASRTFTVAYTSSDGNGVGVANVSLWFQAPGAGWALFGTQTTSGAGQFAFAATMDGPYAFVTIATDLAGNKQEFPVANNTWTVVDTTPPRTHVVALPTYETSLAFTVSWVANASVTDVANYTIQVNLGSGWTTWLPNTTAASGTYRAAGQGPVAFRSIAQDFAGNVEPKTGNDTWTLVDTIPPSVVSTGPSGSGVNATALIVITFSEPMDPSTAQAAFGLSPSDNGTFTWSGGGTVLTFHPGQPLRAGTTYTVTVAATATDVAGNALAQPTTFSFSTPAAPPASLAFGDLWWLFLIVIAAVGGLLAFILVRRRSAGSDTVTEAPKPAAAPAPGKALGAIDDVFLLYRRDGVLIKHETRRLRPDIDTDILSGMLTAVQQFVKDSFHGDEDEELNEMTVGQMHILIGRGKYLIVAATLTGGDVDSMTQQIKAAIQDMEDHNWDRLEDWDGDMEIGKALTPYLKKLIQGTYADSVTPVP